MAKLGRPKDIRTKSITFRLKASEYADLRKCAIAEEKTMAEFIRNAIKNCKRKHMTNKTWPDTAERE